MSSWVVFCRCGKVLESGWCYGCNEAGEILPGHFACEVPWRALRLKLKYDAVYMDYVEAVERYGECDGCCCEGAE
jgi:hypothetical protein